jgi:hypothetical protein
MASFSPEVPFPRKCPGGPCVDHRNAWVVPMHQLGDRKPIQRPRHMDVGNKQSEDGSPSFDKPCRFVAVFGRENLKPGLSKFLSQNVTDQSFVFDDKNAQGLHPGGFLSLVNPFGPSLVLCVTPCFLLSTEIYNPHEIASTSCP